MAELELIGPGAVGKGYHLVAEAYAEYRQPALDVLYQLDDREDIFGVAGAVGKKDAVGMKGHDPLCRGVVGNDDDVAAALVETPDDIVLYATVDGDDIIFIVGRAAVPHLFAGYRGYLVVGHGGRAQAGKGLFRGDIYIGQDGPHAAFVADHAGYKTGIDARNARDAVFLKLLREGLGIAEVGGGVVILPDDKAADAGRFCLVILVGKTIVAD